MIAAEAIQIRPIADKVIAPPPKPAAKAAKAAPTAETLALRPAVTVKIWDLRRDGL